MIDSCVFASLADLVANWKVISLLVLLGNLILLQVALHRVVRRLREHVTESVREIMAHINRTCGHKPWETPETIKSCQFDKSQADTHEPGRAETDEVFKLDKEDSGISSGVGN
jgi:hypothetical protein